MIHVETTTKRHHEKQVRYKYSDTSPETIKKSAARAKQKVKRLMLGNLYNDTSQLPKFLTLTFDPKKHQACNNIDYVNYQFKKFRQRLQYSQAVLLPLQQIEDIAVPAQQLNSNWHYHMFVLNLPFIHYKDFENKIWQYGGTNMKRVQRSPNVARYITKYFTKSYADNNLRGKKRYFHSLINEPAVIYEPQEVSRLLSPLIGVEPCSVYRHEIVSHAGNLLNVVTKSEYLLPNER